MCDLIFKKNGQISDFSGSPSAAACFYCIPLSEAVFIYFFIQSGLLTLKYFGEKHLESEETS